MKQYISNKILETGVIRLTGRQISREYSIGAQ